MTLRSQPQVLLPQSSVDYKLQSDIYCTIPTSSGNNSVYSAASLPECKCAHLLEPVQIQERIIRRAQLLHGHLACELRAQVAKSSDSGLRKIELISCPIRNCSRVPRMAALLQQALQGGGVCRLVYEHSTQR